MAQAVSSRRVIAEVCVRPHVVRWLRRLVAGVSPRRSVFDPTSVLVRVMADRVEIGGHWIGRYAYFVLKSLKS